MASSTPSLQGEMGSEEKLPLLLLLPQLSALPCLAGASALYCSCWYQCCSCCCQCCCLLLRTVLLLLLPCSCLYRCVSDVVMPVDLTFALDFPYLALSYFLGFGCLCLCLGLVFLALTFVMPYLIFRVLLPYLGFLCHALPPCLCLAFICLTLPYPFFLGFGFTLTCLSLF